MDPARTAHRIESAVSLFQKGIYHLFFLKQVPLSDAFEKTLRTYQSVYHLAGALMLCDFDGVDLDPERIKNKRQRERVERDPGPAISHGWVEKWCGFEEGHPLYAVANNVQLHFTNVVEARHNVIYRPYMLMKDKKPPPQFHWEDCSVENLIANIPAAVEIEPQYRSFHNIMKSWEPDEASWLPGQYILSLHGPLTTPPLTLLLNYARLLDSSPTLNHQRLKALAAYRDELLGEDISEPYLDDDC